MNIEELLLECVSNINKLNELNDLFKENTFYTLVEEDEDGSYFIAIYDINKEKKSALYLYTSEEEVTYGADYMEIKYEDLLDLISSSNDVNYVVINSDSENVYFEVKSFVKKGKIEKLFKC